MINKLRRRFVLIATVSVLTVIALVFFVILALNVTSMNRNVDMLADRISEGGGIFPDRENKPEFAPPKDEDSFDFITPETPFSTRHFTVLFNGKGEVEKIFTESIYSIGDEEAVSFAKRVVKSGKTRGWLSNYRYKKFSTGNGVGVVFVDGSVSRANMMQSSVIAGAVLLACAGAVIALIFLMSGKAVRPIAESYEKQKQFITDANHELKTPLTLILANLDIAESELGKNEWLDDIRSEGYRMTELVNQLVAVSRMDEDCHKLNMTDVPIGKMAADAVSEFKPLAEIRGKTLASDIEEDAVCRGDASLLYRLIGILLDNAVKYCDNGGNISVTVKGGRKTVIAVENTYAGVGDVELNRLFDRFYRADKARKFTGGYGVGLSMAKSITEKHKGDISAYKKDGAHIGFKVII